MTRMKESGIDWIGQIPEEWEVVRLQDVGDYKKGPFGSAITIDMFIEKSPGSYKVYEQKNAIRGNCEIGEAYIPKNVYNNLKNFSVYPLDIIVSCAGTIGKCYILPEDCEQGIINQALMRVRVNKSVNLEYFLYIFDIVLSYAAIKYSNGSAIKNIPPFNVLNKLRVTLPSNIEQLQIVNYLDKKIPMLDKAKALLEEQIQKLKDYRASLIYETVTKGLDKTVPLKDSGIDWIGQVPEGWEIVKFKYLFNTSKGLSITKECLVDEGIPVINYGQIHSSMTKQVRSCDIRLPFVPDYYLSKKGVNLNQGDFVFADTSEDLEGAGNFSTRLDSTGQLLAGYHTIIVRLNDYDEHDFKYFMHLLDSLAIRKQIQNKVSGVKVYSVTQGILNSIFVITPPKNEQQKIANLLDKKTAQIDNLIQIKNQQIENINKQRQTLIYDYVTGKRRV